MSTVTSRGTVSIDVATCKGCELCIAACPPGVLTMTTEVNRLGHHYPQLHPGCTGCAACLLVCPDFCFEVFRFEPPPITQRDPGRRSSPPYWRERRPGSGGSGPCP